MVTLELQGRINEKGNLEVHLPDGLPEGEVTVRIDVPEGDWDNLPWTEAEIRELMTPDPKSGAEIVAMLQQMEPIELLDSEISDPVEWVEAQCRKDSDRLKPHWKGKR